MVLGNIPYSMTSRILEFLLVQRRWVKRAVLMIQKEVADRLVAKPGTKVYSSISVMVQTAFEPKILFTVPPGRFYPQPKVTSAVVRLVPVTTVLVPKPKEEAVLRMVRKLFTHRRKTVLNALLAFVSDWEKEPLAEALKAKGLDPKRRPETFSIPEMVQLVEVLENRAG